MPTLLLLPPSEGKLSGGAGAWDPGSGRHPQLAPQRRAIAAALRSLARTDPGAAVVLTGLRGDAGAAAAEANACTEGAPTLPAHRRYIGVVWDHLHPATLSPAARRRAAGVLVPSALGGVWAWGDAVPDYKLKITSGVPGLGALTAHWSAAVTAAVVAQAGRGPVVDLLPAAHRRLVALDCAGPRTVRVEFVTADGRGAAGHGAKAVKGKVARQLLEVGGDPCDALDGFGWEGWDAEIRSTREVVVRAPAGARPSPA